MHEMSYPFFFLEKKKSEKKISILSAENLAQSAKR